MTESTADLGDRAGDGISVILRRFVVASCLPAIILAIPNLVVAATRAGGITIVTPENGSTVRPGTSVRIVLQVDSSLDTESVLISTKRSVIKDLLLTSAPYEGDLIVPKDLTGAVEITTAVRTTTMQFIRGPTITINVVPADAPTRLDTDTSIWLDYPQQSQPGTRQMRVRGIYADGARRNITVGLGTTYSTSDPAVVTVDTNGLLTATGTGIAYVTTENSGVSIISQVAVRDRATGAFPTIDVTTKLAITSGGFRADPDTGLYVQQVSVRNTSDLPITNSLTLIVSGLPEGVVLENSNGETRKIAPIGSRFLFVKSDEKGQKDFIPPGKTGTATLKFSNHEGVPITYSVKIYTGLDL